MNKPTLGTKPYWIAIKERNIELAKAIIRHCEGGYISGKDEMNVKNIKEWAVEIVGNCNTELNIYNEMK